MTDHAVEHRLDKQAKAAQALADALRAREGEDDSDLLADMVEGETGLMEALDAAVAEIDACDVIVEGCKAVEEKIAARRHRAQARRDKVRAAIEQALLIAEVGEKVQRPTATFTMAKGAPKLVIDDESEIPSDYFTPQPPKLDKTALRQAAEQQSIPGCHLTNAAPEVRIRRK